MRDARIKRCGQCTKSTMSAGQQSTVSRDFPRPNQHLKPWQTDRTMIRINAMMIPKTINLIFIFWIHIFLLIFVPCCRKSCACNKTNKSIQNKVNITHFAQLLNKQSATARLTCDRRFSVLSTSSSIFSPRSRTCTTDKSPQPKYTLYLLLEKNTLYC